MNNGFIKYKSVIKYLGILISDIGNVKKDADLFIDDKRREMYSKFANVCARNYLAPLKILLKVLTSCVSSTLLYECECWGEVIPKEIEQIYRMAIKTALSIRTNTNNEIVYLESGF